MVAILKVTKSSLISLSAVDELNNTLYVKWSNDCRQISFHPVLIRCRLRSSFALYNIARNFCLHKINHIRFAVLQTIYMHLCKESKVAPLTTFTAPTLWKWKVLKCLCVCMRNAECSEHRDKWENRIMRFAKTVATHPHPYPLSHSHTHTSTLSKFSFLKIRFDRVEANTGHGCLSVWYIYDAWVFCVRLWKESVLHTLKHLFATTEYIEK